MTTTDDRPQSSHLANNYLPLPITIASADGCRVTDINGKTYIDALAGYSALNFGHRHPRLLEAARRQLDRITLTSRAFHSDTLGPFTDALAALIAKDVVLPMNTGAEAVETALKVARRWGHQVKGVIADSGTIVVMGGNFHGRTTTIISFSDDDTARAGFGPYTPGFLSVPFGDAEALRWALTDHPDVIAVLLEPIQGEQGVMIPPSGYLKTVRELCTEHHALMIADEVQSGLGRTGYTLAIDHDHVVPDIITLGKALGGGIIPVSAVLANHDVMDVITPGSHGSTFGGNPLACAVATEVVAMLETGEFQARAKSLETPFHNGLEALIGDGVVSVRVRGLWAGVDIDPKLATGKEICLAMAEHGVLAKETHGSTIRLAPPLTISEDDLQEIIGVLRTVIAARH